MKRANPAQPHQSLEMARTSSNPNIPAELAHHNQLFEVGALKLGFDLTKASDGFYQSNETQRQWADWVDRRSSGATDMTDKMKSEFEAWASSPAFGLRPGHFAKDDDGEYVNYPTQCYWQIWQASREALVIELPPKWNRLTNSKMQAWDSGIEDARKAIEAAGLKVRP